MTFAQTDNFDENFGIEDSNLLKGLLQKASREEAFGYISEALIEFRRMALHFNEPFAVYLIEMAFYECYEKAGGDLPSSE